MKKNKLIFYMLLLCMIIGVALGVAYALALTPHGYAGLHDSLEDYFRAFHNIPIDRWEIFRESLLKHAKIVVIIWVIANIPVGGFGALGLIIIRGAGYGFTTALLIKIYGFGGAICAALLYFPQAALLVPVYFYSVFSCVSFILKSAHPTEKFEESGLLEYFFTLIAGCMFCVIAGLMDAFLAPWLVQSFI